MIREYLERFRDWLLTPVFRQFLSLCEQQEQRTTEICGDIARVGEDVLRTYTAVNTLNIPDYSRQFISLHEMLEENRTLMPQVTFGFLMLWEALNYAARKYDRDPDTPANQKRRESEIRLWTQAYLAEYGWPDLNEEAFDHAMRLHKTMVELRKGVSIIS